MKLVSYEGNGVVSAGICIGSAVLPLGKSMNEYILSLAGRAPSLEDAVGDPIPLSDVRLLAPIPRPLQDIVAVGRNYQEHADEAQRAGADYHKTENIPTYFSKRVNYAPGPGESIDGHFDVSETLDYECELGVILGRDASRINKEDAYQYIFGYTIINDISARGPQRDRKQFYFGKSLDTFSPMGPWIVTRDEIEDGKSLELETFVNGELRQHSWTDRMIFSIPELLEDLTSGITLLAGTVIATGTPSGVGGFMNPPAYLKSGDVVTCRIEQIGELVNTIR